MRTYKYGYFSIIYNPNIIKNKINIIYNGVTDIRRLNKEGKCGIVDRLLNAVIKYDELYNIL